LVLHLVFVWSGLVSGFYPPGPRGIRELNRQNGWSRCPRWQAVLDAEDDGMIWWTSEDVV